MNLDSYLQPVLDRRQEDLLYRERTLTEGSQSVLIQNRGKTYINFCSNDYLGLASHPKVIESLCGAAKKWGVGSGASHLVNGHFSPHHALEEELAAFTHRPRAILFSTGYMANLGVINALMSRGDEVFQDRLNHASLIDAALLSSAKMRRYKHNDMADLERQLGASSAKKKLIVVDGVFSMDGDFAKFDSLKALASRYDAWLMADEAHALGCLGKEGRGSCELFSLDQNELPILMGTLGKAFGTFGAFVAGSEALIESLIQFARTYIYTTALPPAIAEATRTSLTIIQDEPERRERLQSNIQIFKNLCTEKHIALMPSETAIQPVVVGETEKALKYSYALEQKGFLITAIRPPTVPAGSARLRVTLCSEHRLQQIEALTDCLREVLVTND